MLNIKGLGCIKGLVRTLSNKNSLFRPFSFLLYIKFSTNLIIIDKGMLFSL
jgi:hypothetical protein